MKRITSIIICAALPVVCSSFGKEAPKANPYKVVLAAVPLAELPVKAADLVLRAKPKDRKATTVDVVKGAVGINPAAATSIVGAIARAVPDMASTAAAAAATEQPKQASAIAKAAAAAAPSQAGAIVKAVCHAVPVYYPNVAVAVSQVVPGANKEIVQAVGAAQPALRPSIERVLAGYNGKVASVGGALAEAVWVAQNQAQSTPAAATLPQAAAPTPAPAATIATITPGVTPAVTPAVTPPVTTPPTTSPGQPGPLARGPVVGPPYFPLLTTPTNITSATSTEVPEGGRNYAKP